MRARLGFAVLAACLSLTAACTSTSSTTAAGRQPVSSTTLATSAAAVVTHEETYVDHSRPTPKFEGVYPGAPSRTLRVLFFAPGNVTAPSAPLPLVLFSHGLGGTPEGYTPLLTDIARHGYLVAAPTYPLTNHDAPKGNTAGDLVYQPGDVSFVLDQVIAQSKRAGWMHGLVDPNRVATGGHSLGGITTYGVAFNACCRDSRIKAAFVIDGLAAGFPDAQYFTGIHTPLLAIHGGRDELVGIKLGRAAFDRANAPKYFMTIIGGKHSSDARGGDAPGQRALTAAVLGFLDRYVRDDRRGLAALKAAAQTPGVTTLDAQP